jgi:hypothetical protein
MRSWGAGLVTVAISSTTAKVRASRAGRAVGAGVGGRGARADCNRRVCAGCAQWVGGNGGVVSMDDGAVTFKGGSISNTKAAVRAPSARRASARRGMVRCAVRHG